MKKLHQTRNWFLKVGTLLLTIVVIASMFTVTAFADGENVVKEVQIVQTSTNLAKPSFHLGMYKGFIISYQEEWEDKSQGTTVYWWKFNLEASAGYRFGEETQVTYFDASKLYGYLEIVSDYEAILYVSTRRIEMGSQGNLTNPSLTGVYPGGTGNTAAVVSGAPTYENGYRSGTYTISWENGFCYLVDGAGQKATGKVLYNNGTGDKWYFLSPVEADYQVSNYQGGLTTIHCPVGAMVMGAWVKEGTYYYFFQADGTMAQNVNVLWNGQYYYVNSQGVYTTW